MKLQFRKKGAINAWSVTVCVAILSPSLLLRSTPAPLHKSGIRDGIHFTARIKQLNANWVVSIVLWKSYRFLNTLIYHPNTVKIPSRPLLAIASAAQRCTEETGKGGGSFNGLPNENGSVFGGPLVRCLLQVRSPQCRKRPKGRKQSKEYAEKSTVSKKWI